MNLGVVHNPEASRFEVSLDTPTGRVLGWCSYRLAPGLFELHHTEVPAQAQGKGLAAALVRVALDWARGQGLRVRPSCSYVAAYMRRHPQTLDLLA